MILYMDAHPIPQNVTSFQFRLIGQMTLKQFLYLSMGMSVAYVSFVFFSASVPIIAWPIIIVSSGLGAAFAFLPIADRPLDYWAVAFFKAVYSPTKRVWNKNGHTYSQEPLFFRRINLLGITSIPVINPSIQISRPTIPNPFTPKVVSAPLPVGLPTKEELSQTVDLARQAQGLQTQIIQTQKELDQIKKANSTTGASPQQYSDEINKVLTNLNQLVTQASSIKQMLGTVTHAPAPAKIAPKVEIVAALKPKQTQVVLTTTQNVINGIVTDAQGNYLDTVVVVIYNKEGLPVRALKTNKLGQFSGATPLPNGKYTLQLEKDSLAFDVFQLTLEGNVLPPLVVSAKKLVNT